MAFANGTFQTPTQLLSAINALLVANGWTKLRGVEPANVQSPVAARFWRVISYDRGNTSTNGIRNLQFRGTPGGPNLATDPNKFTANGTSATGRTNILTDNGTTTFNMGSGNYTGWVMTYEFDTPTVIREILYRGSATVNQSPLNVIVTHSNDGVTWDTMFIANGLSWTASETKLFTFPDGYLNPIHPGPMIPSRAGRVEDTYTLNYRNDVSGADLSNDVWTWEGPGYDASRRVYISLRGHNHISRVGANIELIFHTGFDPAFSNPYDMPGTPIEVASIPLSAGESEYWIYANNHRLVIVVRGGAGDYSSGYVGFMGAFTPPEYYPFPLIAVGSAPSWLFTGNSPANNRLSSIVDPGDGCGHLALWTGVTYPCGNRESSTLTDGIQNNVSGSRAWCWPCYTGGTMGTIGNPVWPTNAGTGGSHRGYQRVIDYIVPTEQMELPLFPCIVQYSTYGNLGTLTDVFVIPSGGFLGPEQVITLGGDNYRVFANRLRRGNGDFFAIREA